MKVKKEQLLYWAVCCCFLLSIFTGAGFPIFNYEAEMISVLAIIMLFDALCKKRIFRFEWEKRDTLLYFLQILLMLWQFFYHSMYPDKTMTFLFRHITMFPMLFVIMREAYAHKLIKLSIRYILLIDFVYLFIWFFRGNNGSFINSYQYVAAYSSILVIILLAKMFTISKFSSKDRYLLLIAFLVLIMTGKRSYLIILMGIFLFGFVFLKGIKKGQRLLRLSIPAIIGGCFFMLINPNILSSFVRFSELSRDSTLSGRTKLWSLARYLWNLDFWTGIGYGSFSTYTKEHLEYVYSYFGVQRTYAAHNIYLQLLAETGIIGICIFLVFFAGIFFSSVKLLKKIPKTENEMKYLVTIGIFIQIWFLLYGMSGNPLYMPGQFGIYLFGIMLIRTVSGTMYKKECE